MKHFLRLTGLFMMLFIASCSSNSDDDDIIVDNPTSTITYTNTINSIISGNCLGCHGTTPSNGAPMSLSTYNNVKDAVTGRNLIARVENGTMPPNGNLTATQIQNLKTWQTNGFPQ
ncbi:cytochrome c [uncultured Lutibacter sp.]|uniref:c-type cytochrome n=1 Tax=uncultured Lutibacter sp. TaxID=437739 RepID=UPI00261AE352|nr:cytochrome c [uncultured Lutibacter sp.]